MVKNILFSLGIIILLLSCSKKNVEIKGEIKEGAKKQVYLEQVNVDNLIVIDSARTDKQGRFKFKTNVTTPTFYNIKVGQNEIVTVIAEPDEKIEISGTFKDLKNNYWVDGSENSLWIKLLNFQLNKTKVEMDSLKKLYTAAPQGDENNALRTQIIAGWDSLITKQIDFSRDFILKHAISPASYYALYQKLDDNNFILTPENDLQSHKIVASSLKAMHPESQYTTAILNHLNKINKNIQNQKMRELIANADNSLPEINLPNIYGKNITLDTLKGKYIILDFTILSTPNAGSYINNLKTIYNKYRGKGVEIYQVCLDPNKLLWEKSVKDYRIPWICVWDAAGLKSKAALAWNIQNIPANYIINKNSEIVGKNLDGSRLDERLKNIVK